MGVQRQQERWAFLHDTHSSMPCPWMRRSCPLGFPKPTLQLQVS